MAINRLTNAFTTSGANGVVNDASGSGSDGGIVSQITNRPILAGIAAIAGFIGYNSIMGN